MSANPVRFTPAAFLLVATTLACSASSDSSCGSGEMTCGTTCIPNQRGHGILACVNGAAVITSCVDSYQLCGAECIPPNLVCCGSSGSFCDQGTTCCNGNQCCGGGTCNNNGCGTNYEDCQGSCWATLQECQAVSCGGGSSCKQCP